MNTTSIPTTWKELNKLTAPIDLPAFLQSDLLLKHNRFETFRIRILPFISSISLIASGCIIYHILRSHKGLTTTYHRLVFGLCNADIIRSVGILFSAAPIPEEFDYFIPHANGNRITCDAQGFVIYLGSSARTVYFSCICLYYLTIITFNKRDDFIRTKVEPWFHWVSIGPPLMMGIILLTRNMFNHVERMGVCFVTFAGERDTDLPHCIGYENGEIPEGFKLPCGRGSSDNYFRIKIIRTLAVLPFLGTPIVIITTVILMYRSVLKIERNMQKYGVGALRLRTARINVEVGDNEQNQSTNDRRGIVNAIKRKLCLLSFYKRAQQKNTNTKSNSVKSQKRAILFMASAYATARAMAWVPLIFLGIFRFSNIARIVSTIMPPLQGLYNFAVYMSPKVRFAKNSKRLNLNWSQAFWKAWMSKGERPRNQKSLYFPDAKVSFSLKDKLKHLLYRSHHFFKRLCKKRVQKATFEALHDNVDVNSDLNMNVNLIQFNTDAAESYAYTTRSVHDTTSSGRVTLVPGRTTSIFVPANATNIIVPLTTRDLDALKITSSRNLIVDRRKMLAKKISVMI